MLCFSRRTSAVVYLCSSPDVIRLNDPTWILRSSNPGKIAYSQHVEHRARNIEPLLEEMTSSAGNVGFNKPVCCVLEDIFAGLGPGAEELHGDEKLGQG